MARKGFSAKRMAGWALVAALTAAALTACVALGTGGFGDTEARVLGSSLGFGLASAVGASGAALRTRRSVPLRLLGALTMVGAVVSFVLWLAVIWRDDPGDAVGRVFGCATLTTLALSHASLVLGARRAGDTGLIRACIGISLATAGVDSLVGVLAIAGAFEEVDEGAAELVAILIVVFLLTTVLPPILRRIQRSAPRPASGPGGLAAEVLAAADRIERLNADPGSAAPQIRRECERLRELARLHS